MATLEKEDFWGCELKKGSDEVKFNPEFEDSELSQVEHKLILSQACLGAKANGRCLVEVTSLDYKGEENKHVIVSLRSGSTEMCPLNLSFSPPASFKLLEGSGPVHLTGNHIQSLSEDQLDSSSESDESDEEEVPMLVEKKDNKNKRPLPSSTPSGPSKKLKKDEEEEEESSSEEDIETTKPVSTRKAKQEAKKKPKNDEEESEEDGDDEKDKDYNGEDEDEEESDGDSEGSDDDEEEEDDDEDDDDEDSEEDSDEEESEEDDEVTNTLTGGKASLRTSPRKAMTNGVASKKDDKQTPSKAQQKTPAGKSPKDLNTIKQAILKSPSLPKKFEKFKNFMRSSYKITDEETTKEVWDYVQKNKK